jgi:DNA-binding CsgD family transcriptional regulator
LTQPADMTYEVSSRERGRLLARSSGKLVRGERTLCHKVLHGLDEPCAGCPLFAGGRGVGTGVVQRGGSSFRVDVVQVTRNSDDHVVVRSFGVDNQLLGQLVRARFDHLARQKHLTGREHEVLALLILGRTHEQIASAVGITPRTVKYHKENILRKFGVESRLDLLRLLV